MLVRLYRLSSTAAPLALLSVARGEVAVVKVLAADLLVAKLQGVGPGEAGARLSEALEGSAYALTEDDEEDPFFREADILGSEPLGALLGGRGATPGRMKDQVVPEDQLRFGIPRGTTFHLVGDTGYQTAIETFWVEPIDNPAGQEVEPYQFFRTADGRVGVVNTRGMPRNY